MGKNNYLTGCSLASAVLLTVSLFAAQALASDPNSPTGSAGLLVVDKKGAQIDFVDPVTHALLSSFDVTKNPHEIAISPDHKTAYVTVYGPGVYGANPQPGHSILVIDLVGRKLADEIDVSPYVAPHGIMIDASGTLYVTCDVIRKLLVIDPVSHKIESVIDTEGTGHFLALLPDASKAYISNKNDRDYVSVVDLHANRVVRHIPAPGGTEGLAVSPDGKRLVVALHDRPSLLQIDTSTDQVIDEVPLQGVPQISKNKDHLLRVRFTPDGSKVLAAYYPAGVLSVMPAAHLHQQTLLVLGKGLMGMAFTPDSQTALVSDHDNGRIAIVDLKGKPRYTGDFDLGVGVESLSFF